LWVFYCCCFVFGWRFKFIGVQDLSAATNLAINVAKTTTSTTAKAKAKGNKSIKMQLERFGVISKGVFIALRSSI